MLAGAPQSWKQMANSGISGGHYTGTRLVWEEVHPPAFAAVNQHTPPVVREPQPETCPPPRARYTSAPARPNGPPLASLLLAGAKVVAPPPPTCGNKLTPSPPCTPGYSRGVAAQARPTRPDSTTGAIRTTRFSRREGFVYLNVTSCVF